MHHTPTGASAADAEEQDAAPVEPAFLAFAGQARRLDGRPASESRPVPIPAPSSSNTPAVAPSEPARPSSGPKKAGKLMYRDRLAAKFAAEKKGGSGSAPSPAPPSADDTKSSEADGKEESKDANGGFLAFKGKARTLRE